MVTTILQCFSMAAPDPTYKPVMSIPHIGPHQGLNVRKFRAELTSMGYKCYGILNVVFVVGFIHGQSKF